MINIISDPGSVTFLIGGLGAGKTELALNLALLNARRNGPGKSHLLDLDIVNPFFRVRKVKSELEKAGVILVAPDPRISAGDLPALPIGVWGALDDKRATIVCDVGGGELGLKPLARLKENIDRRNPSVLFVMNPYRPGFLSSKQMHDSFRIMVELSALKVTHIVANPHLVNETTPEVFRRGLVKIKNFATEIGLPILFGMAAVGLWETLQETSPPGSDTGNYSSEQSVNLVEAFTEIDGIQVISFRRFWEKPWKIGLEEEGMICPSGL